MEKETEKFPILRITDKGSSQDEDTVVREFPLTITLNDRELVTLLCSPTGLDYLAIGFLLSEGFLKSRDEINKLIVDDRRGVVRVETNQELAHDPLFKRLITSGCGRGASFYDASDAVNWEKLESSTVISASRIADLVREFQQRSMIFRTTGGVHSAALCNAQGISLFAEDIGRHNAIDKIFGECLLTGISTEDRIIVTSGRISSEILLKIAKRKIPILISKSAPTNLGIKLANDMGVTLVGFVRGYRMNIYSGGWRISADGNQ
jgi:FdhD protein